MHDRLRLELQNKTYSEMRYELYRLLRLPQLKRGCIDASGLGNQMAEEAREEFGWKVEPIVFTAPIKEELAFGLRRDFEDRTLRLVREDKLRADLRGLRKEVTISGNIRFTGESPDSHCDRTWALALRQHAARYRQSIGAMVG
jgi:phage FluMu gp28-like protein